MTPKNNINPKPTFLKHFYLLCIFITCYTCIKAHRLRSCPWLKNTRPYMSHLKAKIKRPVFQKNSPKLKGTESGVMRYLDLCTNVLVLFLPKIQYQITSRAISKTL